jgi:2-polyprenyl-6-methoxyphenol hydroxylase-like FAD-dependent oxidoreductase
MREFREIKYGTQCIGAQALDAYEAWRADDNAMAAAVADKIVEDCETLLAQAKRLAAEMRSLESPAHAAE